MKKLGELRDKACELVLGVAEGENPDGSLRVAHGIGAADFATYQRLIGEIKALTMARSIMLEQYRMLFEQPQPGGTEGDGVIERTAADPIY